LRCTTIPPGGDAPGLDKVTVRWVEQWRNAEDYDLQGTPHLAENGPKMVALAKFLVTFEFEASENFEKTA